MPESYNTKGFLNLSYELIKEIFNFFLNILKYFKNFLTWFIDIFFNGNYYKYYIFITLLLLFSLIFYLIYYINPYSLFSPKIAQLSILIIGSIFLILFYFCIHRRFIESHDNLTLSKPEPDKADRVIKNIFIYKNFKDTILNPFYKLLKSFLTLLFLILIPVMLISLLFLSYKLNESLFYLTKTLSLVIIIITTFALLIKLFNVNLNEEKCLNNENIIIKLFCIIKYLILFLPCMVIILIEKIRDDLKLTTKSIYILFILELLLICLFFFLPILFNYLNNFNTQKLLKNNEIIYTNKYRVIGNYQSLRGEKIEQLKAPIIYSLFDKEYDNSGNIINPIEYNLETIFNGNTNSNNNIYKYNYGISFYLYLNPQENNTNIAYNDKNGVVLFNYGNKPVIKYNGRTKQLIIESYDITNNDSSQKKNYF